MKNVKVLAVVTTALMLGGWGCGSQMGNTPVNPPDNNVAVTPAPAVAEPVVPAPAKAPAKKPVQSAVVKGMKYEEALEKYRESGLLQFVDCHATPGTFTFKKGYTFMIDNRDAKARTIVVQGIAHRLEAYSYALVTAQKTGESFITCDGGGSATLKIQA